jgi:hypothetical protein|nr:MAG TPA: hypothetical protein [Caudoviricetes sp.]
MTGIENALQDMANVITILAGFITIVKILKGK